MTSDLVLVMSKMSLGEWYDGLSEEAKRILSRYASHVDESKGAQWSLLEMAKHANLDENHKFAITLATQALTIGGDALLHFLANEEMITATAEINRNDEAKWYCEQGLKMVPIVIESFKAHHGGTLPDYIGCRNRLIDIIVGLEGDYDRAESLMMEFVALGLLDETEAEYRIRSLKIHRLQRTFDSVYSVRFVKD